MNKTLHFLTLTLFIAISISIQAQEQATIRLTEKTLMHEMRATPFPLNKSMVSDRCVSFQWPLKDNNIKDKTKLRYSLRYSSIRKKILLQVYGTGSMDTLLMAKQNGQVFSNSLLKPTQRNSVRRLSKKYCLVCLKHIHVSG